MVRFLSSEKLLEIFASCHVGGFEELSCFFLLISILLKDFIRSWLCYMILIH